jgi:Uma2 family endonuclease
MTQTLKAATAVPVEVYLRSEYEPDAEYVDGEIEVRPTGENDHSAWQDAISYWFRSHAKEWNIFNRPELRIRVSETRFRIPDVTILDRSLPTEQVITRPPLAVFEILSPEDTLRRLKRKLEDYRLMGIPEIWVIDPEDGACSRYEAGQLVRSERFSLPSRGIAFDFQEIRALLEGV